MPSESKIRDAPPEGERSSGCTDKQAEFVERGFHSSRPAADKEGARYSVATLRLQSDVLRSQLRFGRWLTPWVACGKAIQDAWLHANRDQLARRLAERLTTDTTHGLVSRSTRRSAISRLPLLATPETIENTSSRNGSVAFQGNGVSPRTVFR